MVFQKSISPQQAASNLVKNAVRIPSLATGGKKQTTSIRWQVGGVGELSPLNFKPHDVGQTSAHLFGCQHF